MDNQKRENLLNLALDVTEEERRQTVELNVGFDETDGLWEVIVRYAGDITRYRELGIEVVPLLGGYAILRLDRAMLDMISGIPEIAYIEKPKRLFFSDDRGRNASCIPPLQLGNVPADINTVPQLYGAGILVGVADSGIDVLHPAFRNSDGSTRIVRIWDQTREATEENPSPFDYRRGAEYTEEQINGLIRAYESGEATGSAMPAWDSSGHGTAVAGVAAGSAVYNVSPELINARGVAPQSRLVAVKMGIPGPDSFPRTTELMMAVDYCVRTSLELGIPIAVNLSIGNTYGAHDGTSLLETYLDMAADVGRNTIVTGAGNEGAAAGHTSGILRDSVVEKVQLAVAPYETKLSLQIWKNYEDIFGVELSNPSGAAAGPFQSILGTQEFVLGSTKLLLYYGEPAPYSTAQEIYVEFIPAAEGGYIDSGIWEIRLIPSRVVTGMYNMWLPESSVLNLSTRFLRPAAEITLTIPSTAAKVITAGAYNAALSSYSDFSGRGYTRTIRRVKPDIVAPGVNIFTAAPGGGFTSVSGTSFAAPFVTGAAALLMEWGIVNGNDLFLYGEKVKAYLIRGARELPGFEEFPNPSVGWGALCVAESIPRGNQTLL